ncbi:Thioredoxin O1- mitochondrial [Striga hermonthica]|uniref:Thioredoxin O1- mitochondrial n=1 Tax=Striga hermonthica TaxID=68872 RepID=A0A9N7N658_STRHE|nr:Thioredoxin O1- mitochondrial [Striga hermonthica]
MRGVGLMLRRLAGGGRVPCSAGRSLSIGENLIPSSAEITSCSSPILSGDVVRPLFLSPTAPSGFQGVLLNHSRSFSSSPSSDTSKVVLIETEEQFNDSLRKVQDESLHAIFYFTAVWCPPCRLLSPIIGQLSETYPHVTTYKIDIDKEELGNALDKLNIHSVPTLHFFQDGKKASEFIGADVKRFNDTMETLYKKS